METIINWAEFFSMIPFMGIGIVGHILIELFVGVRTRRKDFKLITFVERNYPAWAIGVIYCLLGCYVYVRGFDLSGVLPWDLFALFNGFTLGALGKGTIKLLKGRKTV